MSKRIGPALARKPLHFFWLLDVSGSMSVEDKIGALNRAIRSALPHLREEVEENPGIEVLMRVVTFAHDAEWHIGTPTPLEDLEWTDVAVVEKGTTEAGRAIDLVTQEIAALEEVGRGLPPVMILVSDGKPTDFKQPSFGASLRALDELSWGKKASRVAIGIGEDADNDALRRFIGHDEVEPVHADNPEELLQYVRWASTVVVGNATAGRPAPASPPPVAEPEPLEVPLPEDVKPEPPESHAGAQETEAVETLPPAFETLPPAVEPTDSPPVRPAPISAEQLVPESSGEVPDEPDDDDAATLVSKRFQASPTPTPTPTPTQAPTPTPTPTPAPSTESQTSDTTSDSPSSTSAPRANNWALDVPLEPGHMGGAKRPASPGLPEPISLETTQTSEIDDGGVEIRPKSVADEDDAAEGST